MQYNYGESTTLYYTGKFYRLIKNRVLLRNEMTKRRQPCAVSNCVFIKWDEFWLRKENRYMRRCEIFHFDWKTTRSAGDDCDS